MIDWSKRTARQLPHMPTFRNIVYAEARAVLERERKREEQEWKNAWAGIEKTTALSTVGTKPESLTEEAIRAMNRNALKRGW